MPTANNPKDPLPACAVAFMAFGPPPPLRHEPNGDGWLEACDLWGPLALDGDPSAIRAAWTKHREQIEAAAAPGRPWCEQMLEHTDEED